MRRLVNDYDLQQPWELDKQLTTGKKLWFGDRFTIRYDGTQFLIRDEVAGKDVVTINENGLTVFGSSASQSVLSKKSASPTVAVSGGTPTPVTVVEAETGYTQIIPIGGSVTAGGTFGTNETVTVTITAHYSDGTTGSITKSFTATGTQDITLSDIVSLIKDGVYITEITAEAQSSATSTSATITVEIAARQC